MFDRQTFNRDELGCFLKTVWQATYRWSYCDFRTTSQSFAPRLAERAGVMLAGALVASCKS